MAKVLEDGTILVLKEVLPNNAQMQEITRLTVAGLSKEFTGEWIHDRWSVLYNAYDMEHNSDIRAEHIAYPYNVSRLEFASQTGKLEALFKIASKLFPHNFDNAINECVKRGVI